MWHMALLLLAAAAGLRCLTAHRPGWDMQLLLVLKVLA
jgi:hypothetical protein